MAKILVVEDDEFFRFAIKNSIESNKHEVTLAENGEDAVAALMTQTFDCIVSDIQMPVMGGIELLKWTLEHRPTPFIMMTGFAENIDTQNVIKLGATDLLLKPFSGKEAGAAIERALSRRKLNTPATQDTSATENYCQIPLGAVLHQGQSQINIYKKEDGYLMKLVSRGEVFDSNNFFNRNDPLKLYTEKDSLAKLMPVNLIVTKAIFEDNKVNSEKKMGFLKRTGRVLHESIKFDGLNIETTQYAKEYLECMVQSFDSSAIFELMTALEKSESHVFANALGVACCGVMIAKALNWQATEMVTVALSGFFHDVGKLALNANILDRARPLLNVSERKKYETHPSLGRDILIKSKFFSEVISTVVYQHHENNIGTGFPNRLKKDQIHPVARLIRVADEFCKHALRNPDSLGMSSKNALLKMEGDTALDSECFAALKSLVSSSKLEAKSG